MNLHVQWLTMSTTGTSCYVSLKFNGQATCVRLARVLFADNIIKVAKYRVSVFFRKIWPVWKYGNHANNGHSTTATTSYRSSIRHHSMGVSTRGERGLPSIITKLRARASIMSSTCVSEVAAGQQQTASHSRHKHVVQVKPAALWEPFAKPLILHAK